VNGHACWALSCGLGFMATGSCKLAPVFSLSRAPQWPILERHLDELESLLDAWNDALVAPDYELRGLAEDLEDRIEAQLDGLRIAGPAVLEPVVWPMLATADEPRAAAAALAALTVGAPSNWDPLLAELGGVARAVALAEAEGLEAWLQSQLSAEVEPHRAAALVRALASRNRTPAELLELLARPEPELLAAAAFACRFTRDPTCAQGLAPLFGHELQAVRHEAIESGLILRLPGAWAWAQHEALGPQPGRRTLTWLAALGDAGLHASLLGRLSAAGDPRELGDLLWAASLTGRPAALDAALPYLGDPELGPLAGEVVCAIAGLASDDEALWRDRPRGPEEGLPPLELDDLDADLTLSSDDLLPMPEPLAIARWWSERRASVIDLPRLLGGRPWSPAALLEQIARGPLRRNGALAFELAVRSGGAVQLNTSTWARAQLRTLSSAPLDAITLTRDLGTHD
jgi:uncharacterized protein (TIGR02270 family)